MPPGETLLTLLVPCFDEAGRLDRLREAAEAWAARHGDVALEVLCVDDGSGDDTAVRLARWQEAWPAARLVRRARNGGKGAALKTGVAEATGRYVIFLDADLAVGLEHVGPALDLLAAGADVVAGCRNVPGAAIRKRQRWLRRVLGRCYLKGARLWLGLRVADVTCGFKGFRRDVAQRLFERTGADRWGFDAEVLYLAQKAGCDIRELPVQWYDGEVSAVRMRRDVFSALWELAGVRLRHLFRAAPVVAGDPGAAAAPARRVAAGAARDA